MLVERLGWTPDISDFFFLFEIDENNFGWHFLKSSTDYLLMITSILIITMSCHLI